MRATEALAAVIRALAVETDDLVAANELHEWADVLSHDRRWTDTSAIKALRALGRAMPEHAREVSRRRRKREAKA